MKVKFKYGIGSFSGTLELATFYETPNGGASFMRRWVKPKLTAQNAELGVISKNMATMWGECSEDYKANLVIYCEKYQVHYRDPENPFQIKPTSFAMFVKMFYRLAAANIGTIELKSLSFGDLSTLFPEITNVNSAINEGYLEFVPGCELLTENM